METSKWNAWKHGSEIYSFIIEQESYYITLLRYIEANPKRAGLVNKAELWEYGSLNEREQKKEREMLDEPYIELKSDWTEYVNESIYPKELVKIRNSVNRQAPLGEAQWQQETATKYGLLSTLNQRGRPRKV